MMPLGKTNDQLSVLCGHCNYKPLPIVYTFPSMSFKAWNWYEGLWTHSQGTVLWSNAELYTFFNSCYIALIASRCAIAEVCVPCVRVKQKKLRCYFSGAKKSFLWTTSWSVVFQKSHHKTGVTRRRTTVVGKSPASILGLNGGALCAFRRKKRWHRPWKPSRTSRPSHRAFKSPRRTTTPKLWSRSASAKRGPPRETWTRWEVKLKCGYITVTRKGFHTPLAGVWVDPKTWKVIVHFAQTHSSFCLFVYRLEWKPKKPQRPTNPTWRNMPTPSLSLSRRWLKLHRYV